MEEQKPTESFHFSNETWSWKELVRNGSVEIDYDRITKACLRRLTGNDLIRVRIMLYTNADSTVGFANQFRAFAGVFLVALVTGRRLRSRIEKDDNI